MRSVIARTLPILALALLRCGNGVTTGEPGVAATQSATSATATQTSICEVVAAPHAFDGRRVKVYGCISTDGQEHSALTDPKTTCGGGGLVPVEAPALPLSEEPNADANTIVCGSFTGTFRASNALYQRVLEIDKTEALTRQAR